jgi:hypothetical protein
MTTPAPIGSISGAVQRHKRQHQSLGHEVPEHLGREDTASTAAGARDQKQERPGLPPQLERPPPRIGSLSCRAEYGALMEPSGRNRWQTIVPPNPPNILARERVAEPAQGSDLRLADRQLAQAHEDVDDRLRGEASDRRASDVLDGKGICSEDAAHVLVLVLEETRQRSS